IYLDSFQLKDVLSKNIYVDLVDSIYYDLVSKVDDGRIKYYIFSENKMILDLSNIENFSMNHYPIISLINSMLFFKSNGYNHIYDFNYKGKSINNDVIHFFFIDGYFKYDGIEACVYIYKYI